MRPMTKDSNETFYNEKTLVNYEEKADGDYFSFGSFNCIQSLLPFLYGAHRAAAADIHVPWVEDVLCWDRGGKNCIEGIISSKGNLRINSVR